MVINPLLESFAGYWTGVLSPMNDVTGQSGVIDSYLGDRNSFDRQHLSHYIKDIAGRFSGSDAVSVTKELFG